MLMAKLLVKHPVHESTQETSLITIKGYISSFSLHSLYNRFNTNMHIAQTPHTINRGVFSFKP